VNDEEHLRAGARVGDYEVERLIGQGAYGLVYAVVHPLIGKRAAAKVLHRRVLNDEHALERFIDEARAVNQIGHPNIVDIFNFGALDDGRCYHLMELLEGETLEALLLRKSRLPWSEAEQILRPIGAALDAAHARQIAHRDLKPSNVFLPRMKSGPKLLDFGIAKLWGSEASSRSSSGVVIGTPYYMSPEQIRGTPIDHRTDIYSFGAMTYQLLTGRPPFTGTSSADVFVQHLHNAPEHPSKIEPSVPRELGDRVLRMLEKDREKRPSSIYQALTPAEDALAVTIEPQKREPSRRSRRILWIAVASVIAAAAIAGPIIADREQPVPVVEAPPAPRVRVMIENAPHAAEVQDSTGRSLGRVPIVELERMDRAITLVVIAEGFERWTHEVTPNRDQTVVAVMTPVVVLPPPPVEPRLEKKISRPSTPSKKVLGADDLPSF
jgi:tRNA A-37 threonylcarbamoyl transferase component Bud32